MNGFAMGSAMGLMLGAGVMMILVSGRMRKTMKRKVGQVKKFVKNL